MQDLLAELLWDNETLHQTAARFCHNFPGYLEAQRQCNETAEKIQALLGFELYDQFCSQLNICTSYEVRAYYLLGLDLRNELVQAFKL